MAATPNTVQKDKLSVEMAMRQSKEAYERERELRKAQEVQFIDDFKRAILLEGGYVRSLGPEAVESQVAISLANPALEKVKMKKQQSTRLMQMMKAFTMEDDEEEGDPDEGLDDDDEDEWDPLQYARSRDSDDESSDSFNVSPPGVGNRVHATSGKARARSGLENGGEDVLAPRNRDEERIQLARALRESQQEGARQSARGSVLSGGSLRHGILRPAGPGGFEEADAQPLPPPQRQAGNRDHGTQKPLPPPQRYEEDQADRDRRRPSHDKHRNRDREAQPVADDYSRYGFKDDLRDVRSDRHKEAGERDRSNGVQPQPQRSRNPSRGGPEKDRQQPRSDRPERQWV